MLLFSCKIKTKIDRNLLRPADVTLQIPCIDKFNKITKFKTRYSFDESLEHLLDYWREEAQKEKLKNLNTN